MAGYLAELESALPQLHTAQLYTADETQPSALDAPVPRSLFLGQFDDLVDTRHKRESTSSRRHSHTSDSGIGSSIHSNTGKYYLDPRLLDRHSNTLNTAKSAREATNNTQISAITRSFSTNVEGGQADQMSQGLSRHAQRQIHKYLVLPLLNHQSAKDFQELIKNTSGRLSKKEFACLRDVEKALLLLEPVSPNIDFWGEEGAHWIVIRLKDHKTSPRSYLGFCETLIQCLHTTASRLSERERTRPADKPYTNAYFLDLVGQIQQYAANMAAKRASKASSASKADEDLGYSSYVDDEFSSPISFDSFSSSGEEVELAGGLSKNGRPVELVRRKGDRVISLATGKPYDADEFAVPALKRQHSNSAQQEDVLRSMARKKKNAPPEPMRDCPHCDKQFPRDCDLTKHKKTHERPFKCREPKCSFHTRGFPTEKECDRHMNDKHSSNPQYYHCHFKCTYKSKRESNLKQHMEKTHNWTYQRSKNNGKGRASIHNTPQSALLSTPALSTYSDFSTPMSTNNTSPLFNTVPYDEMSNTYHGVSPFGDGQNFSTMLNINNGGQSSSTSINPNNLNGFPTPDSANNNSPLTPGFDDYNVEIDTTGLKLGDSDITFSEGFSDFLNTLEHMGPQQENHMWTNAAKLTSPMNGIDESPFMADVMDFNMEGEHQFAAIPSAPSMDVVDDFNHEIGGDFLLYGAPDSNMSDGLMGFLPEPTTDNLFEKH